MYNVLLYHALEIDTLASMFHKYLYVFYAYFPFQIVTLNLAKLCLKVVKFQSL